MGCDQAVTGLTRKSDGFNRRAKIVEEGNGRQDCSFLNTEFASGR